MPSHQVHKLVDKLVLGRKYPHVHKLKDKPYKVLGRYHRVIGHDPFFNLLIACIFGPDAFLSACLHDLTDRLVSGAKCRRRRRKRKK